jgi:hypothetical protein
MVSCIFPVYIVHNQIIWCTFSWNKFLKNSFSPYALICVHMYNANCCPEFSVVLIRIIVEGEWWLFVHFVGQEKLGSRF